MRALAILAAAGLAWAGPAIARPSSASSTVAQTRPTPGKPLRIGRWTVETLGDWVEAWTDNESGSQFGLLCGSDCMIYLDFRTACEEGGDYSAMINSAAGAFTIEMRCLHFEDRQILIADATSQYVDMLEQGGEIGFAFALANGQFRVARFSCRGGYEAMVTAVKIAMQCGKLKEAPKDVSI
jgi:hypothetical protein